MKVLPALLLAAPLLAAAAAPPAVKTAPRAQPIAVQAEQGAQRIKLAKLFSDAPETRIGTQRAGYFCREVGEYRLHERLSRVLLDDLRSAIQRELPAAGYPRAQSSAFEQQGADADVEYQLGLNLVDAQLELCFNERKAQGGIWLKAELELYAPRERKVVFRQSYEGHSQSPGKEWVSGYDLHADAASALVRNMLADPRFVEHATRRAQSLPVAATAAAPLRLLLKATGMEGTAQQMPLLQSAVATLFSGAGSGSAVLIGRDGHWLTNRHVVGDAKYVKLKLANGRELLGEVLRSDAQRDVALLKSETVALAPLGIAEAEPTAGAEVYAIGSPFGERLEGTVTRGVLSSVRELDGRRFLQSDVKVLPGSSGGPLLDGRGGVIGLTSAAIGGTGSGMNLFIPIRDAMTALQLGFE